MRAPDDTNLVVPLGQTTHDGNISVAMEVDSSKPLFHERQTRQQCGLHCVNNLLQWRCYEHADFDRISAELLDQRAKLSGRPSRVLSRVPGAKCCFFLNAAASDYDVQVLELALGKQGACLKWFDRRKTIEDADLQQDDLFGLIVNRRTWKPSCCGRPRFEKRHWLCIRRTTSGFYNLDSHLVNPKQLGSTADTLEWLRGTLADEGSCLFLVLREQQASNNDGEGVAASQKSCEPEPLGTLRDTGDS